MAPALLMGCSGAFKTGQYVENAFATRRRWCSVSVAVAGNDFRRRKSFIDLSATARLHAPATNLSQAYLADFLAVAFFAVAFLAVAFLAVVLWGATFFAGAFLAVVFCAAVFLAGVFLAEASGAGSRPVIFLAAETTAFTIFPPISVMKAPWLMQTSAKLHVARLRKRAV